MRKSNKRGVKRPGDNDCGILLPLYDFRVLTTNQMQFFVPLTEHYLRRKRQLLKEAELIESIPISGGYQNKKRQGNAYAITGKGITLLRKLGFDVEKKRDDLRVTKEQLPFLLTGYDVAFELVEAGWKYTEPRTLKQELNLDRQSVVKGKLTSPAGVDWVFFVTLNSTSNVTLAKFKKDMESTKRYPNKAIIVTGYKALQGAITFFMKHENILRDADRCNIIPKPFIDSYFRYLSTDEEFFACLKKMHYPVQRVETMHELEQWQTNDGYAVLNLLDMDLVKVYDLLIDRGVEQGRIKGFKVITSPELKSIHEELIGHLPYVHFEEMDVELIKELLES